MSEQDVRDRDAMLEQILRELQAERDEKRVSDNEPLSSEHVQQENGRFIFRAERPVKSAAAEPQRETLQASKPVAEASPSAPNPQSDLKKNQSDSHRPQPTPVPTEQTERRRSFREAFGGMDALQEDSRINPVMVSRSEAEDEAEVYVENEPEEAVRTVQEKFNPEEHPLFRHTYTQETFLPKETAQQREALAGVNTAEMERQRQFNTRALDEAARQLESQGVLNVKENADDEDFKIFFGNTVIIDNKPLRNRIHRTKQVREISEDSVEPVKTAAEHEHAEEPAESEAELTEYTNSNETEEMLEQLVSRKSRWTVKTYTTLAAAFLLIYFAIAKEFTFSFPGFILNSPIAFLYANAALLLFCIFVNLKGIFRGFVRMISFRADADSITSFAAIASLIEICMLIFLDAESGTVPVAGVAALALAFSAWGHKTNAKRILESAKTISGDHEKFATTTIPDEAFTRRITREFGVPDSRVLLKRKTGFTDGFLSYAGSKDEINNQVSIPCTLVFFVGLVCGVISFFRGGGAVEIVRSIAFASIFASPFMATLASAIPFSRMQKHLARLGTVVPGYAAVEEIVESNCVLLEGQEILPKGNVMLHGIKTFEKERIDKAILYAASVLIQSCDTLSHVSMNIIQGKVEMLYETDSVVYEDGLGFSFWVDKNRVLLGSRELLLNHEIDVPSRDYENRYTKKSTRDAIYLAVSGKLYAMFVVSYSPNPEVEKALRGLEREGVSVLIRTRDFNVTPERVSRMYRIPRSMISIVSESDMIELGHHTEYVGHVRSAMTHIGVLSSFIGGILACYNVRSALKISTAVELACMLVGATLALALSALGSLLGVGVLSILAFQSCWMLVSVILILLRRY